LTSQGNIKAFRESEILFPPQKHMSIEAPSSFFLMQANHEGGGEGVRRK